MTETADLGAAIAALWLRQRGEMLRRVDVVGDAVAALAHGTLDDQRSDEARAAAHKIAGAAGSFGFGDASAHARSIELALRDGVGPADAGRLRELVEAIRKDFEREPANDSSATPATADVVTVGAGLGDVRAELAGRGLNVAADARGPIAVVNLADPAADAFMKSLQDNGSVNVIGVQADTSLEARVAFTRSGGRTLLTTEATPGEIADAVVALRERSEPDASVLVVDDDDALLELTSTILRVHGMRVTPLGQPDLFWQTLESVDPDVVLLDLEMPSFNGIELCRAVRADPRWAQLPVLFLTARTDDHVVRELFAAGADDYMAKPVAETVLIERIHNRLERVRRLLDLADRDVLTGLANRRKSREELERLEQLSKRYGQPLTLAMLDIDHFKRVNDSFGHETGDAVLRRLGQRLQAGFRGEDVVGRWGGEEFVIGMYGMSAEGAAERLRAFLDAWKEESFDDSFGGTFTTSFTAGFAELPRGASSLEELQQAADAALYRGKAAGRCRVQAAGDGAREAEQVDVAVVDDDPALGELLVEALAIEGWTVSRIENGRRAIELLGGDQPQLHARVVLLDWELPGVYGVEVLEALRERGVLGRTRIVMLTARVDEAEVLRALELGASDHVPKPFSIPVLLQKVRRLLEVR